MNGPRYTPRGSRRTARLRTHLATLVTVQGFRCAGCGKPFYLDFEYDRDAPSVDHVVPRARGAL